MYWVLLNIVQLQLYPTPRFAVRRGSQKYSSGTRGTRGRVEVLVKVFMGLLSLGADVFSVILYLLDLR